MSLSDQKQHDKPTTLPKRSSRYLPLSLRTLSLSPISSTTPVCWPDGEAQIDSQPHPPAQVYLLRSPSPSDVTSPITPRHPTRHTRTSRTHLHTVTYTRTPVLISLRTSPRRQLRLLSIVRPATQPARLRRFLCCSVYSPLCPTSLRSLLLLIRCRQSRPPPANLVSKPSALDKELAPTLPKNKIAQPGSFIRSPRRF